MASVERLAAPSEFGRLLRRYRVVAGLSQEGLAERARMSVSGVSALERGYRRTPQFETLAFLAGALALTQEQRREFVAAAARSSTVRSSGSVTVGPWPETGTPTLPISLPSFIGRDSELEEIGTLICEYRMVTVTGAGGIGKTQTALQAVTRASEAGVHAYFVALAPIALNLVASAIASTLGVQAAPNEPLLETLVRYLENSKLLLVLDNCEHVVGCVALLAQTLLSRCPGVRILATSRERLMAAGERAYRLPSLTPKDAIALFTDRAQAVDARFQLTDENAAIVAEVCRRLDNIPLAIELAAARVNALSLPKLLEKLSDRFRILTRGNRTAPPRQQTMQATIDWSYNLLSLPERRLFERMSVFPGSCSLTSVTAICADDGVSKAAVLDLLSALVDKSMLLAEQRDDDVRYRLLQSTCAYAVEKLAVAGESDFIARRHLRYFRDRFADLWNRRDRTARRSDFDAALRLDLEDALSALSGALTRSEVLDGAELLANLSGSWRAMGLEAEGIVRYEAYLAALPRSEWRLRARLETALSYLIGLFGNKVRAFELASKAVEHARRSGEAAFLASALAQQAGAAVPLRRLDDAGAALAQAESIPGTAAYLRIQLLGTRAHYTHLRGDLDEATQLYEQLRQELRSLGDTRGAQVAALNLAEIEHQRGRTKRAIAIARETRPAVSSAADTNVYANLLLNLAGYLSSVGDAQGTLEAARNAIEIHAARKPDHAHVAVAAEHIAFAFAMCGDLASAAVLGGYADAELRRHGYPREFNETTTHDRLSALLRGSLGPGQLARLSKEGAALTPEAAIALARGGAESVCHF